MKYRDDQRYARSYVRTSILHRNTPGETVTFSDGRSYRWDRVTGALQRLDTPLKPHSLARTKRSFLGDPPWEKRAQVREAFRKLLLGR